MIEIVPRITGRAEILSYCGRPLAHWHGCDITELGDHRARLTYRGFEIVLPPGYPDTRFPCLRVSSWCRSRSRIDYADIFFESIDVRVLGSVTEIEMCFRYAAVEFSQIRGTTGASSPAAEILARYLRDSKS